ncbi:sensor histidine kinase [Fontibacillus sp. BL9]|uniref:sensor histidine kinase n=1 Tax=Fontibacillus sp. BL9 TaxID=3389971 RepID=UPI00397D4755
MALIISSTTMNTFYLLLGIFLLMLVYVPQGVTFYFFLRKFLIIKRSKASFVCCLIVFYIVKSLTAANLSPDYTLIFHLIVYNAITLYYFHGTFLQKLFFSSFYNVFTAVIEMIGWFGLQFMPLNQAAKDGIALMWLSIGYVLIILLSVMLCLLLLRLFQVDSQMSLSDREWAVLMLVPIGSLLIMIMNINKYNVFPQELNPAESTIPLGFVVILLSICIINVAVMYFYHKLIMRMRTTWHNRLLQQQITEYTNKLKDNQKVALLRHDMNHVLTLIHSLLDQGDVQAAQQYIEKVGLKHTVRDKLIFTGNIAIDAICNERIATATENSIAIKPHFRIPQDLLLTGKEVDIAIILGNALDNAVEAVHKLSLLDDRKHPIDLEMVYHDQLLVISVKNVAVSVKEDGYGAFLSSKRNHEEKGLGMESIRAAVQNLNGNVSFRYENEQFKMIAVIPLAN